MSFSTPRTKRVTVKPAKVKAVPKCSCGAYKEGLRAAKSAYPEYSPPKTDLERARVKSIRMHERLVGAHDQRRCLEAANEELNDALLTTAQRNKLLEKLENENQHRLNEMHRVNADLQHQVGASSFDLQTTQNLLREAVEKLEDMCTTSTELNKELEAVKAERDEARVREEALRDQLESLLQDRDDLRHRMEFETLKRQEAELQSGLLHNEVKLLTTQRSNLESSLIQKVRVADQMKHQYQAKIQAYTRDFEALTAINDTLNDFPEGSRSSMR